MVEGWGGGGGIFQSPDDADGTGEMLRSTKPTVVVALHARGGPRSIGCCVAGMGVAPSGNQGGEVFSQRGRLGRGGRQGLL